MDISNTQRGKSWAGIYSLLANVCDGFKSAHTKMYILGEYITQEKITCNKFIMKITPETWRKGTDIFILPFLNTEKSENGFKQT